MPGIDVKKIARLSRLLIDNSEAEHFQREMENIIAMVERLPDTSDIVLRLNPEDKMELRADKTGPSLKRDELLKNAPQSEAGCFVVPKVVE
ncbi:MAG: Asp-tRNA(Asn)/Glu-tRNA(Gln) amidotransferase subunit GatC [Oscillospiraceae bacterium]|jgi:aspartyl-tRNA(Asn)/glutamyl-tRNA(Gln) amidotransferase subunit C|nr:Asp-tRNA(Asn)/Glu-tRNA(Gln) amidotransferase subunit GatC [Oscillospiraceae bacterium]